MDIIKYELIKNGVVIHSAHCPIYLFQHITPYRDVGFCDMTKIFYNNKEYILHGMKIPEYDESTGISFDEHMKYVGLPYPTYIPKE